MSSMVSAGSNSKYENLPGIAHDQPDVYETPDLQNESDPYLDYPQYEDINPSIETPSISVEAAYERFRHQRLNGEVNFHLYRGYSNDPEMRTESVSERLERLKLEVAELVEEFRLNPPSDPHQLLDLQELENKMGLLVKSKNQNPGLLNEKLESYNDNKAGSGDAVQYELCVGKKLNLGATGQKGNELESRIHRLEQVLGQGKESLAPLGFHPNHNSVLGALTVLHSKLGLLEPAHIEIIESRLSSVLQKVNSIVEKKLDVQELERNLKLSSLYDLLEKSASTIEALPELSDRLESLKVLHGQASGVIQEIGAIKSVQDGIAAGMGENDKLLRELKGDISAIIGKK